MHVHSGAAARFGRPEGDVFVNGVRAVLGGSDLFWAVLICFGWFSCALCALGVLLRNFVGPGCECCVIFGCGLGCVGGTGVREREERWV